MDMMTSFFRIKPRLERRTLDMPVIFCGHPVQRVQVLQSMGYEELAVNLPLAKKLLSFPAADRIGRVEEVLTEIAEKQGPALYMTHFEMLFDPDYQLDILKWFCLLAQRKTLAVFWPGDLTPSGYLTYADPSDPEYASYPVRNYRLICTQ